MELNIEHTFQDSSETTSPAVRNAFVSHQNKVSQHAQEHADRNRTKNCQLNFNYTQSLESDLCVKKFAQNRTTGVPDVPVEKNP